MVTFKKTRIKILKILILIIITAVLAAALILSGCKAAELPETASAETTAAEETSAETAEETIAEQTTEEEIIIGEITGNINILNGLEISEKVLNSRPMAIMVENLAPARPQSGLIYADVVFEVVDEHGITRFVAVFSSYDATLVGPVRSTRPYYAEIAAGFNPVYVFWGTHPLFYKVVENLGLDYLSPLGDESGNSSITSNFVDPWNPGEGVDAIRDGTRQRPHNAYVRIPRMKEIAEKLGYSPEGGQSPFHFKEDATESDRGNITDIIINFSDPSFKVDFKYDSKTNTYLRYCGGQPSNDRETGKQITVNNVIVLFTDIKNSGNVEGHMLVRTTQGGNAYYFLDGNVIEGTWGRKSALEPFIFKDMDGKTVLFNRGQTWVAMISGIEQLEY